MKAARIWAAVELTRLHHRHLSHDKCPTGNVRMLTGDKGKGPTEALYHVANFSIKLILVANIKFIK